MTKRLVRAVEARVPLIYATTSDFIYPATTLKAVLGLPRVLRCEFTLGGGLILRADRKKTVMYAVLPAETATDWSDAYRRLERMGSTLILLGHEPDERPRGVLYVGDLLPTVDMLTDLFLETEVDPPGDLDACVSLLNGLTYQEAVTVVRLAQSIADQRGTPEAERPPLTVAELRDARATLYGDVRGLMSVPVDALYYEPAPALANWVEVDGALFLRSDTPALLMPRGLLFTGPPGTGKTAAAKFIARALDVPLYLLSLGDVLSRWQGEAEQNMGALLRGVELRAPCVLLLDEVEKLFAERVADEGVSERLLATLLWWLQEHRSRVLTVMTTNDRDALPPELIRPGRIDRVMGFTALRGEAAQRFVERLHAQMATALPESAVPDLSTVLKAVKSHGSERAATPAQLEATLLEAAKRRFVRA